MRRRKGVLSIPEDCLRVRLRLQSLPQQRAEKSAIRSAAGIVSCGLNQPLGETGPDQTRPDLRTPSLAGKSESSSRPGRRQKRKKTRALTGDSQGAKCSFEFRTEQKPLG